MSLEKAKKYLEEKGYADHVIERKDSSATVQLAAQALGGGAFAALAAADQ